MALRGAEKNEILELLKDDHVMTIVLIGDAGVGKTWIARKIADSADKEDLSYVTLWVFMNQQDDNKSLQENRSLHENIARQLSVLSTIEEWEDNATKEEDHEEEDVESLKKKISTKLEEMRLPDPKKCLFLIVDGVPDTMNENDIMSAFMEIMHLNGQALFKVLITRRNEQVVDGNEVTETKSKIIKIKPLSNEEGSSLFKEIFTKNVSGIDDFAKRIAENSNGLPAAIVVIAEALNRIVEHDCGVWTLESAMKEAATRKDADNSANPLLRFGYEMLPKRDEALIDCCWYSLQFFHKHGGVHYNELIACWILEGYFGPVDHVEKVYEEGHRVLVELIDRHLLKIRDDNAVVVEGLALTILDSCPDRNEGKSSLGLARVFEGGHWQGFGRITHADGLIKTMCNRDKWDKVSTLLIDGSRLSREVLDTFFKPMQGLEVLALFNPTIKSLPSNLSEMDKLRLLVLRGCDLLENVDDVKELKSLTVLEISGATSLKKIPDDFFHKLLQLRSLKLSAGQIKSLPSSISELSELRWLMLRGCASLEELPRLQKLESLLVLDLSGAIELRKLKDKTFKAHAKLRMLDLSQTKIDRLPFLKNLGNLTQLSLRCCKCLTRLPSLKSVSQLEILDLSGSSKLKENQDEIFPSMDGLKTLNLSNTAIRHLPSNNNSLPNLELMNLSDAFSLDKIEDNIFEHLRNLRHLKLSKTNLQKLPSLSNLCNLEILNLSGCSALKEIVDQSFQHMTCLQQLNLSETKIECLPSLSNLSNLCQLLLRNCVNLKELPPLESLSKLEELDLCGARSLKETEAEFLENMVHLRFLNLSGTALKLPPTSNLTNLTHLLLRGCTLSELYPNLEKCTKLEVLDLSETHIQSLPSLDNFSNLRDLKLRDCSSLNTLPCLKSVIHLEVLELWGTGVKEFPYEISELTHLKHLDLPDLKDIQTLEWRDIKYLPEEVNWVQCGIFRHGKKRPCISMRGTDFFKILKKDPVLWETCFKEFQFSVCTPKEEGKYVDICLHKVDPIFRKIYFQTLSLPEEHGKYLEIVGFDSFPSGLEDALLKAEYISLIDNKFIKSLSDLAAGVKPKNVGNVMAMKGCWLERSTEMQTIFGEEAGVQTEEVLQVSVDVSFASNHFPKYKLGADNQILEEPKEDNHGPSLKEVVEQETVSLSEQHKRLSVRDLASKFDKNLSAAAKLSDEAKLREVASLEGHVLLKKLRDALESLRGRLAGRNKEDVEKAISMVEALAVKLTQKEGELIQEKFEVKKLASYLKQASEDAKKLVNQEKSFACAEIESARSVVQRIGEALEEQEKNSQASKKQDVEELIEKVQEARRIKLLHQPSKVVDMEYELRALRAQIWEKSVFSVKLQKELAIRKRDEENKFRLYVLEGSENLGSYLKLKPCSDKAPQLPNCSIQWYRLSSEGTWKEIISVVHLSTSSGANKSIYAPEPFDVGRILQAEIVSNGQKLTVTTSGPIDPAAGLGSYVETLLRKSNTEFNVVISQMNGQDHASHSVHVFHVGKMRIKLSRGWITKARENYSSSMQLCGGRGDINNSAKALFWQARKGLSYVLTFESERDRNAAVMLARKYAFDCNVMLAGPDDQV